MKKILITGGAGYLGSVLSNKLESLGHKMTVIDNLSAGKQSNLSPTIELLNLDILDEKLESIFSEKKPDLIYHLAASKSVNDSIHHKEKFHRINVGGSKNVIDSALSAGITKIIFTSTAGVYGDVVDGQASKESDAPRPSSPYAETKLETEKYMQSKKSAGLDGIILRFANVYGPGGETTYKSAINIFVEKLRNSEPIEIHGDGSQTRDFVYTDDLVDACIRCLQYENKKSDSLPIFNVSRGESTSIVDIVKLVAKTIGVEPKISFEATTYAGQKSSLLDPTYTKKTLDWTPQTTLEEGIRSLVAI